MQSRTLNWPEDREACFQIWRDVGWIATDSHEEPAELAFANSRGRIALGDGVPGCVVLTAPATLQHLETVLPLCVVTGVTTSLLARKRGFARRLLAESLADAAAAGECLAALGAFEQGFYDTLGFGSGPYQFGVTFDPASLLIDVPFRIPERLTIDADWEAMHGAMRKSETGHGAIHVVNPNNFRGELLWIKEKGAGFGYRDASGELTHFVFGLVKDEFGPFHITWSAWQDHGQLKELLAFIRSTGDQFDTVWMNEPRDVQLQTFLKQPFRSRRIRHGNPNAAKAQHLAWWQFRILDLPRCVAACSVPSTLRFNLQLSDPATEWLADDSPWQGCTGQYIIELGSESRAEPGNDPSLPTLVADIAAFSRLWLGVAPASGLAFGEGFSAPPELLHALDETLRLPRPHVNWDF